MDLLPEETVLMKSVLVVDDNVALTGTVREIFEHVGYHVNVVYDGVEGWRQIQHDVPDIIIADINMPEMDGFEFLELVRNYKPTETTPFIFMTARTEREFLRKGMELGADDFVPKPFSAVEIIASVETTLRKREKIDIEHEKTLSQLRRNITYTLPHELRTPLQTITGYAYLMEMDYEAITSDEIKTMSGEIRQASKRLERLIENTLAYAQIELIASDPIQQEQLRKTTLSDTAETIELNAEQMATKWDRTHDLHLQIENHELPISADNLCRIIQELVDNAFKFSEDNTAVIVEATTYHDDYVISVQDQGRGMSSKQIKQIGAYMQFDRVLHEQQGSGLGLAIAKRLVELHLGTMNIDSLPDAGTMITIKIPL